jgi:hypothetical protein
MLKYYYHPITATAHIIYLSFLMASSMRNKYTRTNNFFVIVNPANYAFKIKISEIIKEKVVHVEGKELASDTIISILELPECNGLSKTTLLKIISSVLGCTLRRTGKQQYVIFEK